MIDLSLRLLCSVTIALFLGACDRAEPASSSPAPGVGRLDVRLSAAGLQAAGVVRANLTIRPGMGPSFTPIIAALSQEAGGAWSAAVTDIPAGRQRQIDVVAYDSGGIARFNGGSVVDVSAGAQVPLIILLQPVTAPAGQLISNPMVSLSLSSGTVLPGGTSRLTSQAADPAGQPLTYAWVATCGRFADPTLPSTLWTAPNLSLQRCQLTLTASNAYASTSVEVSIDVQTDPSTVTLMGSRVETCWQDPVPGSQAPVTAGHPAPDTRSLAAPTALVQTGAGTWKQYSGGYLGGNGTYFPGGFGADGNFVIPGIVPAASVVLSFRDTSGTLLLVQTSSRQVDLGYDRLGRCDTAPASPGTSLALQLAQLSPWDSSASELQAASSSAGLSRTVASSGAVPQGATSASLSVDWTRNALLVPNDVLWLNQLSRWSDGSTLLYRVSTAAAPITQLALADGSTTTVAVALSPTAATGALPVQWAPAAFERALGDMAPAGRMNFGLAPVHRYGASASPFSLRYPAPMPGTSLQLATVDVPAQTVGVALANPLAYGRFLPAWWRERREVRYAVSVGYQAAGATDTHWELSTVSVADDLPAPAGTVVPLLSPVRSPAINGSSALSDLSPVSTTPTFSWSPPTVGAPSAYELDIYSLSAVAGSSQAQLVVRYFTGSTSVTLPPGVLAAGTTYFARITAWANDVPYLAAPLRYSPIGASATALTGTFIP